MSNSKLGVFPASGGLGGSITKHLLTLTPPSDLVLISRHPEKLVSEKSAGATTRKADYDDAPTLDHAFDGIKTLFLISYPSIDNDLRTKVHKLAIDNAIKSGVKHIFYSSLAFAGDLEKETVAHVMKDHIITESYLETVASKNPDFSYTIVREGLYSESFPIYTSFFDPKNPVDEIKIPHNGSGPGVAWAKRDELGEASAKLFTQYAKDPASFPYTNKTLLLSGPKLLTIGEVVETLSRIINKPLRISQISVDEYAALPQVAERHVYAGVNLAKEWATAWEAIRRGECAVTSPLLGEILGREPEDYETTVRDLILA
ncbi:hypothetical protein FQN54_002482 [Arachnomyces sp. PD_36]|nr:hypothetical protein FQN54_002482 [Arachnomyces sp. PD_36]